MPKEQRNILTSFSLNKTGFDRFIFTTKPSIAKRFVNDYLVIVTTLWSKEILNQNYPHQPPATPDYFLIVYKIEAG